MQRDKLVSKYSKLLGKYGFNDTYTSGMRSCFDIISSKKENVMLLKLVDNIDSLTESEARALRKLGSFFDAQVFVVFKTYKNREERSRSIFTRHDVECISGDTLESLLGGSRVARAQRFMKARYRIDGGKLKRARELNGMSIRVLSKRVGMSKDSIYRYESQGGNVTDKTVYKLERFFDAKLTDSDSEEGWRKEYRYNTINDALDVRFMNINTAPFYTVGKRHFRYEIGNVGDPRTMKKLAEFYRRLDNVLNSDYPFFVTGKKSKRKSIEGIPVVERSELAGLEEEKDLIDLIMSRHRD